MKPRKKSSIFTFLCSFLPGAAEMYLGFMKMGFSLMLIFFISFALPAMCNANDTFLFIAFAIWFYGFFHARNIASAEAADFEKLEDRFIWEEFLDGADLKISNKKKWSGIIVILVGVALLWSSVSGLVYNLLPEQMVAAIRYIGSSISGILVSLAIIIIGVLLIRGKKEELFQNDKALNQKQEVIGIGEDNENA